MTTSDPKDIVVYVQENIMIVDGHFGIAMYANGSTDRKGPRAEGYKLYYRFMPGREMTFYSDIRRFGEACRWTV
jgi:hypothetical protein